MHTDVKNYLPVLSCPLLLEAMYYLQGSQTLLSVINNLILREWRKLTILNQKVILVSPRWEISLYIFGLIFDFQTMCKIANFFITKSGIL